MAEAHQAVHVTPEETYQHVKLVYDDEDFLVVRVNRDAFNAAKDQFLNQLVSFKNELRNSMFPNGWLNCFFSVAIPPTLMLSRFALKWKYSALARNFLWKVAELPGIRNLSKESARVGAVTAVAGTVIFVTGTILRRFALRTLLNYQRWLYEPPRKQSYLTYAWYFCVRSLTGRHPLLYSFQKSLPRLPVPSLSDTVSRYVESVRPIYDSERMEQVEREAAEFLKKEGPQLQRYLIFKSWISDNYITDWWEKYVYLRGRDPVMINSNYYVCDLAYTTPTSIPAARAGAIVHGMFNFKELVENEMLEPMVLRDTVPMCMDQYKRIFGTNRTPGLEVDELNHYAPHETQHVAVQSRGCYFSVNCYSRHGKLLRPDELEKQFQKCINMSQTMTPTDTEARIGAFTAGDRTYWAEMREKFFSAGANQHSLKLIETAAFVVNFDEDKPESLTDAAYLSMHGKGYDRWFDKSINLIVYANGKLGLNCEHSWADAPVIAHLYECTMVGDAKYPNYDSAGHCIKPANAQQRQLPPPAALQWSLNSDQAKEAVKHAVESAQVLIDEFELKIHSFTDFGKGHIKTCKVSPDAYIQVAFQVAFHRMHKVTPLTYESSMTRLFQLGRTETIRPASNAVKAFVTAYEDESVPVSEKKALFAKACERHQILYRDAMTGRGIDRHLFGLYVISQGTNVESSFLKHALSEPWRLSTSQQPQQQTHGLWNPSKEKHLIGPGGGFGPVSSNGYGVSYMVAGENQIFFHVSSNKGFAETDSNIFAEEISKSLNGLKDMMSQ